MAARDAEALVERLAAGEDLDKPLESTVMSEMFEFIRHFRPMICQAGYRCLKIERGSPDAWKTHAFQLRIERIPNPPIGSRAWAHYKVVDATAIPFSVLAELSPQNFEGTLKQGKTYHEENARLGCV